jgi:hypothetical protein
MNVFEQMRRSAVRERRADFTRQTLLRSPPLAIRDSMMCTDAKQF